MPPRKLPKPSPNQVAWKAQEGPQLKAIQMANIPEMLYGGARGGGKTSWLLGDFAQDVPTAAGPAWHGIIFRRTYGQLEEVIRQSLEMYPRWFDPDQKGLVRWMAGDKIWKWSNGATLKLRYLESQDDWTQYHGHQYSWIGWDELTTWPTPELYMKLKATLRSSNPLVKYKRIRATANPGGIGHNWVKEYFRIGDYPNGSELLYPNDGSNMTRIFIKSKLTDNKILMTADPQYIDRMQSIGSPELIKAWVDGDWDVVQGAYFPEFRAATHVVTPFEVPATWTKFRCMDWGSSAPFAVYWVAVSDGNPVENGRKYQKGALVVYREWYGGQLNNSGRYIGLKLTAEEVAEGILDRQASGEEINDSIIDPAAWAQNGGPSIAERMSRATDGSCTFRRGDNKRLPGWDMVRERLKGNENGPMIYFFESCPNIIRTLPSLQHDVTKQEDVDTDGEDHACFIGGTKVNGKNIEDFVRGDLAPTRFGMMKVDGAGITGITDTVKVSFSDGTSVICTPDHRFLSEDTWTQAKDLKGRLLRRSYSRITAKSFLEYAIIAAGSIFRPRGADYIGRFGNTMPAKSQKDFMFTTKITTDLTIGRRILYWFLGTNTYLITPRIYLPTTLVDSGKPGFSLLPNGTQAQKALLGIRSTEKKQTGLYGASILRKFVSSVEKNIRRGYSALNFLNSAIRTAKPLLCVDVEPQKRQLVYCLSVSNVGEFLLDSGLIVSNCDALRYGCMSRPWTNMPEVAVEVRQKGYTLDELWEHHDQDIRRRR